jgi:hypothetical protein
MSESFTALPFGVTKAEGESPLVNGMTRDEFKRIAQQALEEVTVAAERQLGQILPREYCFSWLGKKPEVDGDVAEFLVELGYVDETHIWPCWDLFLERLTSDGKLHVMGYRAGFAPCPYGEHFSYKSLGHGAGHVGPFKLGCTHIVEQQQRERR